jgi:hypothetical protein
VAVFSFILFDVNANRAGFGLDAVRPGLWSTDLILMPLNVKLRLQEEYVKLNLAFFGP